MKHFILAGLVSVCFSQIVVAEDSKVALVTGDEIRLRSEPSKKGKYQGILYKNQVVTILERTEKKEKVEDKEDYWYKVKYAKQEGWCFGQFLTLDFDRAKQMDTYATTKDFGWFFERYGEGTAYESADMQAATFTPEEYRSMIREANEEHGYIAAEILGRTLFAQLRKNPSDPKLAYFKELLDSEAYWLKVRNNALISFLPESLAKDKDFIKKAILNQPSTAAAYLRVGPATVQDDAELVLKTVDANSHWSLQNASKRLLDNEEFMLKALRINKRAISFASERLKKKLEKEFPVPQYEDEGY